MNISIRAKLSVEREPVIGQTLIDMRGRKPAWEGIYMRLVAKADVDSKLLCPCHLIDKTASHTPHCVGA